MDVINHDAPQGPIDPNEPPGPNEPIEHRGPNEHDALVGPDDPNEPMGPNEHDALVGPDDPNEPMGPNEHDALVGPYDTNEPPGPTGPTIPSILSENIDIINNTLVCYCIRNEKKTKTYVGATNHFCRRIRQHNREIVGGAKATGGYKWHKIILVHGFDTRHDLLSFEWHFKHVRTVNKSGIKRRVEALTKLLSIDRWKMLKFAVIEELQPYF